MDTLVIDTLSFEERYLKQIDYFEKIEQILVREFPENAKYYLLTSELKDLMLLLFNSKTDINDKSSNLVQSIHSKFSQLFLFMCINFEHFADLKESNPIIVH